MDGSRCPPVGVDVIQGSGQRFTMKDFLPRPQYYSWSRDTPWCLYNICFWQTFCCCLLKTTQNTWTSCLFVLSYHFGARDFEGVRRVVTYLGKICFSFCTRFIFGLYACIVISFYTKVANNTVASTCWRSSDAEWGQGAFACACHYASRLTGRL